MYFAEFLVTRNFLELTRNSRSRTTFSIAVSCCRGALACRAPPQLPSLGAISTCVTFHACSDAKKDLKKANNKLSTGPLLVSVAVRRALRERMLLWRLLVIAVQPLTAQASKTRNELVPYAQAHLLNPGVPVCGLKSATFSLIKRRTCGRCRA